MATVQIGDWEIEEDVLNQQHEEAMRRGHITLQNEPQAKTVSYDPTTHRLIIELKNEVIFLLPCKLVQGLATAQPEQIAQVEIGPRGASLLWEDLDVGFSVPGLLAGVFGTQAWMAEMGSVYGKHDRCPP